MKKIIKLKYSFLGVGSLIQVWQGKDVKYDMTFKAFRTAKFIK